VGGNRNGDDNAAGWRDTPIDRKEPMPAYAMAHLHNPNINDEVLEYLERIQATLDPHDGRFIVHGGEPEILEGSWPGTVVVIEFPSADAARAWYHSDAYADILALRTDNIRCDALIIEGVARGHDSALMAQELRAQLAA
jgi:uncharacterized protein (DUF1330 family)